MGTAKALFAGACEYLKVNDISIFMKGGRENGV